MYLFRRHCTSTKTYSLLFKDIQIRLHALFNSIVENSLVFLRAFFFIFLHFGSMAMHNMHIAHCTYTYVIEMHFDNITTLRLFQVLTWMIRSVLLWMFIGPDIAQTWKFRANLFSMVIFAILADGQLLSTQRALIHSDCFSVFLLPVSVSSKY